MDVVTCSRPWSNEVSVWFVERDRDGGVVYMFVKGKLEPRARYENGADMPPPTIIMEAECFAKLLESAKEFDRPTPATARHLDDAIVVRDRLLLLVESMIPKVTG